MVCVVLCWAGPGLTLGLDRPTWDRAWSTPKRDFITRDDFITRVGLDDRLEDGGWVDDG